MFMNNNVKMTVLLNMIYRFNANPMKIPASYVVNIVRYFKVHMERTKDPEQP